MPYPFPENIVCDDRVTVSQLTAMPPLPPLDNSGIDTDSPSNDSDDGIEGDSPSDDEDDGIEGDSPSDDIKMLSEEILGRINNKYHKIKNESWSYFEQKTNSAPTHNGLMAKRWLALLWMFRQNYISQETFTLGGLYYLTIPLFTTKASCKKTGNKLVHELGIPGNLLGVKPGPTGMCYGAFSLIDEDSEEVNFLQKNGYPIYDDFQNNKISSIHYHGESPTMLIVIETLLVFYQILLAKLARRTSTIFVCLGGNPTKNTTGLICFFKKKHPELKIFHFRYCGPEGVSIMVCNASKVYKNKMPNSNNYDAKWIGIFPSQVGKYNFISYKVLTPQDRARIVGFQDHEWMNEKRMD